MNLITILISLALEKYFSTLEEYRKPEWFIALTQWCRSKTSSFATGSMSLLVCLIPVLLVIGILYASLWPIFSFLFGIIVLVFSFGPRDLLKQSDAFIEACERGDKEAAALYTAEMLGTSNPPEEGTVIRTTTKAVLVQANERFFAVLFWFMVLGPVGAALFRMTCVLHDQGKMAEEDPDEFYAAVYRLRHILNWVPARLTIISYALSGSFVDALSSWRSYHDKEAQQWPDHNDGIIAYSGTGALQLEDEAAVDPQDETEEVKTAVSLALRALIIWVSVIAVMTIVGLAT
jgi:membrane protein required for beta-lactamase induction